MPFSFVCVQLWLQLERVPPVRICFGSLHSSQVRLSKAQFAQFNSCIESMLISVCNFLGFRFTKSMKLLVFAFSLVLYKFLITGNMLLIGLMLLKGVSYSILLCICVLKSVAVGRGLL